MCVKNQQKVSERNNNGALESVISLIAVQNDKHRHSVALGKNLQ
jgi:hypothetical protein